MVDLESLRAMAVEPKQWTRAEAAEQRTADRRASACSGKAKHETERKAMAQARRSSAYLDVYLCRFCDRWHVGNRISNQ